MDPAVLGCLAVALAGGGLMVATLVRSKRVAPDIGEFLDDLGYAELEQRLSEPLLQRLAGGVGRAVSRRAERLLPRQYLEAVERRLAQAGMTGKRRAGEQVAMQVGLGGVGAVVMLLLLRPGPPPLLAASLLLLPVMGFILPTVRLSRAAKQRSDAIFKDLPDIVDMLAIAVEAGSGFEAALSLVCAHFESPLTDELSMALREMELGMPRRDALQQLRERADLDVVRTLVLALLQADSLGIPIGRVLKAQATEVRARRRAWARERAAKLPVKILFPLVLFIFPPILALVLGPAAAGFAKVGGG